jgi:hypothetical protein
MIFDEINDTYLFRSLCHIHRQCHHFKPQEDRDLVLDIVLKELQQQRSCYRADPFNTGCNCQG